uniref:Puromycin-sensitive aminopeptidase n=2 Tax=Acrobeloides nanus TaxID=290746 RepID=A0A914DBZ0_9BILA
MNLMKFTTALPTKNPIVYFGCSAIIWQFQYSNAETINLWDELSRVSGQNIIELMSSWTKQMGFPLVNVEQRIESGKRILKLRQERFILDGKSDDQDLVWKIPINICAESSPDRAKFKILMTDRAQEFELEGVQPNKWIKLNQGNAGFYRVQYTDEMLESFLPAIKNKKMHAMDRFGIANDLFSLVESERIPATNFLDFIQACSNEDNHIVWEALDSGLEQISKILMVYKDGTTQKRFHCFVNNILSPIAEIVGWESNPNEDSQISFLRATILNRLAHSSHPETIKTALQKFKKHFEDKVDLDKDL